MELNDYLRILRRRWVSILVAGVIVGAAITGYSLAQSKQYVSTVRLFTSAAAGGGTPAYTGVQAAQQSVATFADFVNSDDLAAKVIQSTGVSLSVDSLKSEVKAVADYGTSNLTITVSDSSATQARAIANGYATQLIALVHSLAGSSGGASALPLDLAVFDPASTPQLSATTVSLKKVGLGLVVGLFIGFGIAILREAPRRPTADADPES